MSATVTRTRMARISAGTATLRPAKFSADRMPGIREYPKMLLGRGGEQGLDVFPVHQMIEEGLHVIGTAIAIVDVIGMFPHIAAEHRRRTMHQRIFAVRRLGDDQLAVLHREPGPARAELGDAGLAKSVFIFSTPPRSLSIAALS